MKLSSIIFALFYFLFVLLIAEPYSHGQEFLEKRVMELAQHNDYAAINGLIEAQETEWKIKPNVSYFQNMATIGVPLAEAGPTDQLHWLGRKVIWTMLL